MNKSLFGGTFTRVCSFIKVNFLEAISCTSKGKKMVATGYVSPYRRKIWHCDSAVKYPAIRPFFCSDFFFARRPDPIFIAFYNFQKCNEI